MQSGIDKLETGAGGQKAGVFSAASQRPVTDNAWVVWYGSRAISRPAEQAANRFGNPAGGTMDKVTLAALGQMKRDGQKIVGMVAYDYQMAQMLDRAGVEIVSVGDSVGHNAWGQSSTSEITVDEMVLVGKAVRRGVQRALMNCDFPFGPQQESVREAVRTAIRYVKECGADTVKVDDASEHVEAVRAIVKAGIPVFAQLHNKAPLAVRLGEAGDADELARMTEELVEQAKALEEAGASLLDFTFSGPVAGPAVVGAVSIPVVGGTGGGPWRDERITVAQSRVGYAAAALDDGRERYANVAPIILGAITAYAEDVRAGRPLIGEARAAEAARSG